MDIDQDTYITAESSSDIDKLEFYTAGSKRMEVDSTGNVLLNHDLTVTVDSVFNSNVT